MRYTLKWPNHNAIFLIQLELSLPVLMVYIFWSKCTNLPFPIVVFLEFYIPFDLISDLSKDCQLKSDFFQDQTHMGIYQSYFGFKNWELKDPYPSSRMWSLLIPGTGAQGIWTGYQNLWLHFTRLSKHFLAFYRAFKHFRKKHLKVWGTKTCSYMIE